MVRMRLHSKRITRSNQIGSGKEVIKGDSITAGTGTITTATITNAKVTTKISGLAGAFTSLSGLNVRIPSRLVLPSTPYTGANVINGAIYATGLYIFLGRGGVWKSELLG